MKRILIPIGAFMISTNAIAQEPQDRAPQLQKLVKCRTIADSAERLTCFDKESAAFDNAERNREIVVLDKAQVQSTRRSLFGLALPRIKLFGGGDKSEEEVDRVESVVRGTGRDTNGRLTFTIADGARWGQIDDRPIGTNVRVGTKVTLRRAALGSFFAIFEGGTSIKVRRVG